MANAAQMNRDVINFAAGQTYEIALKYPTGKQISNGRIMFSTTDNEVFFITQDEADQIYALDLRPQEKFRATKEGRNLVFERIPMVQQSVARPTAAATIESVPTQPSQLQGNSLSSIMASSYISAIDALLVAKDYADAKGIPFKLSSMEIRACAHSIFIQAGRQSWQR